MSIIESELEKLEPIPVMVMGTDDTREYAPELASWASWNLQGTEIQGAALQILAQDTKRKKARISINAVAITDYVIIGRREQVMNGQGGHYYGGDDFDYEAQSDAWMVVGVSGAPGNLTVSVIDQRFIK